ncbi:hypothetical protein, partial [Catenibacterium sp.]|uniref:hypothetical protein n=1 Tax=Catenibacterium sp. TaxID=2049022 RepID=UPI00307A03A1
TDRGLTSCGGSNPSTCAINKYNSGFVPEFFCALFQLFLWDRISISVTKLSMLILFYYSPILLGKEKKLSIDSFLENVEI